MVRITVRKGDRKEGKLQVLDASAELARHSLALCKNEKLFPKSQRWLLSQRIVSAALDICGCIREANATMLGSGEDGEIANRYRRSKQVEAHAKLNALLTYINIAYDVYSLDGDRVRYWTELTVKTDELLKAWMKSDRERLNGRKPRQDN